MTFDQATLPGFLSEGLSTEEGEALLGKLVKLVVEARDKFWESLKANPQHNYNRALVEESISSYGAYLADGSDYSGFYGPDIHTKKLKDCHRCRLQALLSAGPYLLAFEAIPNKLEAQACVELLEEENVEIPSWLCFTSVDGQNPASGENFKECLQILDGSNQLQRVGINCVPPHFIKGLIYRFKWLTSKVIIVYPNSGKVWDGRAKRWLPSRSINGNDTRRLSINMLLAPVVNDGCHSSQFEQPSKCFADDKFEYFATRWRDSGGPTYWRLLQDNTHHNHRIPFAKDKNVVLVTRLAPT